MEEWLKVAEMFESHWKFRNCNGTFDGKHFVIKQLKNTGFYFFNLKGTFNILVITLVDANYKFIYVDVSCNGKVSFCLYFSTTNKVAWQTKFV